MGHLRSLRGVGEVPPASYLVPPGSPPQEPSSRLSSGSFSSSVPALMPKLLLQNLRALHLGSQESQGTQALQAFLGLWSPAALGGGYLVENPVR